MNFVVIDPITDIARIAAGSSLRERGRLRRAYGPGRWRKMKGNARIRFVSGIIRSAELHWYEAHGIGRKEMKIKRFLDKKS